MDDFGTLTPREKAELLEEAREARRQREAERRLRIVRGGWQLAFLIFLAFTTVQNSISEQKDVKPPQQTEKSLP